MIAAGALSFVAYRSVGSLWLALIGWFLLGAAGGERSVGRVHERFEGLHVRDLMTREPVVAPADATFSEFSDSLGALNRHNTYPVVSNGEVLGLFPFGQSTVTRSASGVIDSSAKACRARQRTGWQFSIPKTAPRTPLINWSREKSVAPGSFTTINWSASLLGFRF